MAIKLLIDSHQNKIPPHCVVFYFGKMWFMDTVHAIVRLQVRKQVGETNGVQSSRYGFPTVALAARESATPPRKETA